MNDVKHVEFDCEDCGMPLMDIAVHRPNDPIDWTVVVKCGHCGGGTYEKEIHGRFVQGHNERSEMVSVVDHVDDTDPNYLVFYTIPKK